MTDKVWMLINTSTLVYGGDWKDAESSIRAKVFGHMVELSRDRVKFYQSDLFHDALWLKEEMIGPMSFEWVVRESGTHIGDICRYVKDDDFSNCARYRLVVREDEKSRWILNIYESKEDVIPWVDRHAALDISECDVAKSIEGCIFHPAPLGGWGTPENAPFVGLQEMEANDAGCTSDDPTDHQGDTCPVHEDLGAKYRDEMQKEIVINQDDPVNEMIELLFERPETKMGGWHSPDATDIPTLGNLEQLVPERKENKMEQIIRDLREKYEEASNSKDQLEEYQSNIGEAVDELDTYMSDLDDLISNLDQLPEVSVYVDLDTVSFDS